MAVTIIQKASATFTDTTLPKLYRDPRLNAGSLFLFDFTRTECWNPANTVAAGATVNNLLDGAPGATLRIPTGTMTFVAGKGFQLSSTANTMQRVEVDSGTNYFQTNLTHDFLIQAWMNCPVTDPGAGNVGWIFHKGGSTTNYGVPGPFLSHRYAAEAANAANPDITGKFDSTTGYNGATLNSAAVSSPAGSHLYSLAKIGSNIQIYKDGALLLSSALNTGTPLAANSNPLCFGGTPVQSAVQGSILNRIGAEDLTISAAAAGLTTAAQCAAQIAAEYATIGTKFA